MTRARDAALAALVRVERDGAFAAAALESELAQVRDPREAALTQELVLGVLRRRPRLDELLESAATRGLDGLDPTVRLLLRLAVYQLGYLDRVPARAAVSEAVSQAKRLGFAGLAGLVNGLLRNLASRPVDELRPAAPAEGDPPARSAAALGLPTWLFEELVEIRGHAGALALAETFNGASPRTLRINPTRTSREQLLERVGAGARPSTLSPLGIDCNDRRAARELEAEGLAAYQDVGAQLVALAVAPRPGERILDACAGRGGKTATLAALASGRARIVATDRKANKLERLQFELGRQGFSADTVVADLTTGTEGLEGPFDRVLLDAPCSGSGTLGRRPEIRWRLTPGDVDGLTAVQARLLDGVAGLVRPGGRLVYAVCSVLPAEGERQGAAFCERNPEFSPVVEAPAGWPAAVGWGGGSPLIDPALHGCDGYAICCLTRH